MTRRWLRALALLAANGILFAAALLLLEYGTRWTGLRYRRIHPPRGSQVLWVYDPTKGWFHAPGTRGRVLKSGPDSGDVRINSLGLRGKEVALEKPAGVFRIQLFGDSFAFGVGVDEEHLFPTLLESLLNQRAAAGRRFEVVNMGVSGYSTDQERLLFQELGVRLQPDLVILLVCDNDFEANAADFVDERYYKPYYERTPDGSLALRNTPVPRLGPWQRSKLWLSYHSNAWNMLRTRRSQNGLLQGLLGFFQVAVPRRPTDPPVEITWLLVQAFRREVEGHGARLLVMNTGHRQEEPNDYRALARKMAQAGIDQLKISGLLTDARQEEPEKLWDFRKQHDTHWNLDAHRFVAKVVARHIEDLLQPP